MLIRTFSRSLCAAALGLAAATGTLAQAAYPAKPIRLIVPFPPGGGTDMIARTVAQKVADTNKWNVIVDNRPGAGGNLGVDAAAKAAPDGYTLVMAQTDNVVLNPLLYSKLTYDPVKDLVPVGLVASGPAVLVVRADSPYKTLADVVAAAKAEPGKLTFASPGLGTVSHLISELWQTSSGMKLTHVPYRGLSQALPDVLSGQVDMYMGSIPTLQGHIKGGKVRALAVTTAKRSPVLPQVPTYTESGIPGVELASVWGVMAPAGTPEAVIQRINTELNKALQQPDMREKILASGAGVLGGSPQEMGALYTSDRQRLAPVVRDSGTRLD
jgi:tripartite-type tricarboxylate transporter receptor subunit TctC